MSSGELSFESPRFLHVTWKIPEFFQLTRESGYSLQSPQFPFADDNYSLQLYPDCGGYAMFRNEFVAIKLVKITDNDPDRDVSYEVGLKSRTGEEIEINRRHTSHKQVYYFPRSELEKKRYSYFPDGTLTVFCFVRPRKPCSAAGSTSAELRAETQAFSIFFNSSSNFPIQRCGELSLESPPFLLLTWKIPLFFRMVSESGYCLQSPEFPFVDGRYCLRLFPSERFHCEYIYIKLVNLTDAVPGTAVSHEVGLQSRTGGEIGINRCGTTPGQLSLAESVTFLGQVFLDGFFVKRRTLEEKRDSYLPDGALTVLCSVRLRERSSEGGPKSSGAETQVFPGFKVSPTQFSKRPYSDEAETHALPGFKVSTPQSVKRPKSGGAETQVFPGCSYSPQQVDTRLNSSAAETSDEEKEQEALPGIVKCLSDYRKLLQKGLESDACLVVSGKEFRAHQNILRARSPVFDAIFGHDTAQKKSGRMVIDDLDSESFEDFLEYLYTGDIAAGLSDDNVYRLYKAADMYDVRTLKSDCVMHMRRTLSVDSFCDVIILALRHKEDKLLQKAVRFFKENMERITITVKWQQFVFEHVSTANELFNKAVMPGDQ